VLPVAALAVAAYVAWGIVGSDDADTDAAAPTTTGAPDTTIRTAQQPPVPTVTAASTAPVSAAPTTTATPRAPTIHAWGEVRACRFGDSCLAVSFTAAGFDPPAERFTCIYPNSEHDFSFDGEGKLEACLTGDEGDVVSIRIDDVVSSPVSAADLGTPP